MTTSAVADGLRRRGVDVTTSRERGLLESPDMQQFSFALSELRVLVTHDEDFMALAKAGAQHAGIAYCHPQLRSIGQIIAALLLLRDCLSPDDMRNHLEFL
jgi:Domain of unknown function (DUF5615)